MVERFDLEPPVHIQDVVAHYADLEYDSIPGACDAVVVGLDGRFRPRPLVIVEASHHPRRQRFSLGHELGHILIPGHIGMEICEIASAFRIGSPPAEREAHAFASEVLMPSPWLAEIVESAGSPGDVFHDAEVANVSAAAACLAIHRALLPGCVVALMNGPIVEMSLASPGTAANRPAQNVALDVQSFANFSAEDGIVSFGGRSVRWWRFDDETPLDEIDDDRSASEILREIVDETYADDPQARQHALASINGIAGFAKGAYEDVSKPEQMLARLRGRFTDRGKHAPVMNDPRFNDYLVRKAEELSEKRS